MEFFLQVISLILFIAYRNITATLLPNIIVLATVSSALGIMAGFGVGMSSAYVLIEKEL